MLVHGENGAQSSDELERRYKHGRAAAQTDVLENRVGVVQYTRLPSNLTDFDEKIGRRMLNVARSGAAPFAGLPSHRLIL